MKNPKLFQQETGNWMTTEITLLDLFAGMAIRGLIHPAHENDYKADNHLAFRAYEIAQAMLEERERITKGESNA